MAAALRYGALSGKDVFARVKGFIRDMVAKLQQDVDEEATEGSCRDERAKTEAKQRRAGGETKSSRQRLTRSPQVRAAEGRGE